MQFRSSGLHYYYPVDFVGLSIVHEQQVNCAFYLFLFLPKVSYLQSPPVATPLPGFTTRIQKQTFGKLFFFFFLHSILGFEPRPGASVAPSFPRGCQSLPGDVLPSPACCVLHQPALPAAAAGSAGGGATRQEQVRQTPVYLGPHGAAVLASDWSSRALRRYKITDKRAPGAALHNLNINAKSRKSPLVPALMCRIATSKSSRTIGNC